MARQLLSLKIIELQDLNFIDPQLMDYFSGQSLSDTDTQLLQEQRISEEHLIRLWLLAERVAVDTDFGLKIGLLVNHNAKGILANWVSQASTLAEAFEIFNRHIFLLNPSERWRLSTQKNSVVLNFEFLDKRYPIAAIERSMSALLAWAHSFCGFSVAIIRAEFVHDRPDHHSDYNKIFGDKIKFNAKSNSIVLGPEVMNLPVTYANPYLKQVIGDRAKNILQALSSKESLSKRISSLLASDLQNYSQQTYLCEKMYMSRSTLYRKLKAEQTSFSELLDNARKIKAQWGIDNKFTIEQQCQQLCFNDSSSLYKAYRRWFPSKQLTPK